MSSDEAFLVEVVRALKKVRLEAILVGATAAIVQGVPITTQDVDLLIRDTPRNRSKLDLLAEALGSARARPVGDLTGTVRLSGLAADVDFLFDELSPSLPFEVVRAHASRVKLGDTSALVASLEDVIAAKERARRPKDIAQLPLLRATARVRAARGRKGK